MNPKPADQPYALASPDERARRAALLSQNHVAPLAQYLARLRAQFPGYSLPNFDPCDGGTGAKILFLMEAPGPKAIASGFVSRNNPDQTARNLCESLQEAGIARGDTVLWNIVPWYVGDGQKIRAVNRDDLCQSSAALQELLALLPELEIVVLVGKKAASAREQIVQWTGLPTVETPHPSPLSFNTSPDRKAEMKRQLRQIAAQINQAAQTR